jgi:hypothetical protein
MNDGFEGPLAQAFIETTKDEPLRQSLLYPIEPPVGIAPSLHGVQMADADVHEHCAHALTIPSLHRHLSAH